MTELKPCPFCGGEVSLKDMGYFLMISRANRSSCKCGVFLESRAFTRDNLGAMERAKERLIEKWNRRVNPWHTEKPTEDGLYLVYYLYQPIPNSEEKEALYHQLLSPNNEDGYIKWVDIDGEVVFGEEEIIRWQRIERFKEENNG